MLTARLLALPALLTFILPGCDKPQPGDDQDDAADSEAAAPEDEEDKEEEAELPPVDASQAGEACDQSVLAADCRADDVDGREYCVWMTDTYEYKWTACLMDACTNKGEERACAGGVQYCASFASGADDTELRWGQCGAASQCKQGETKSCFGGGEDDEFNINMGCTTDEYGRRVWNSEDCNTPLVLSFDGGLEFAAATTMAAEFDIHGGAGTCSRADWPTAQTPWLALDRDGNGAIDGGHELFGSATRLVDGHGPHNGFQALAELDSDRDGKITPADARWGELVLWADHDADRRSSPWELLSIASFEIVEIDLGWGVRRDCDARGNCGLERAGFVFRSNGRTQVGEVVDVRVTCE